MRHERRAGPEGTARPLLKPSPKPGSAATVWACLLLSQAVLVLAVPFSALPGFWGAKLVLWGVFLFPALAFFLARGMSRRGGFSFAIPSIVLLYGVYAGFLTAIMLLNPDGGYDGLYRMAQKVAGLCLIGVLYHVASHEGRLRRSVVFLGILAGGLALLGILEYLGIVFYDQNIRTGQKICATLGYFTHLGGYLCVALPFAMSLWFAAQKAGTRILALTAVACVVTAILMTGSRMPLGAMVFAVGLYFLLLSLFVCRPLDALRAAGMRKVAGALALLLVAGAAMGFWLFKDGYLISRFADIAHPARFLANRCHIYRAAVAIWLDSPWSLFFGHGPGAFAKQNATVIAAEMPFYESFSQAHCEVLENLVEGGIVGLALYLLIVISTLWTLFRVMGDRSLPGPVRICGVTLATALTTFQVIGIFSIATRTLVVGHLFYWLIGLSWALAAAVRQTGRSLVPDRAAMPIAAALLMALAWAGLHLGLHAHADNLLTRARSADQKQRLVAAERLYQRVLAVDDDHVEANYYLAHLYLTCQAPEGFYRFADRTEAIIPQYRTINYFRALMDLNTGRYERARDGFIFCEREVERDDPLTLFWLACLGRRLGDDGQCRHYLERYLEVMLEKSGRRLEIVGPDGPRQVVVDGTRVRIGAKALERIGRRIPAGGDTAQAFYAVSGHLARLFEKTAPGLWAVFYGDSLGERKSECLVAYYGRQLRERIATYELSGRKEDVAPIIDLYEQIIRFSPAREAAKLRRRMSGYYLKAFQFKKYSHWKHRVAL